MTRLSRALDTALGLTLMGALTMAIVTAMPTGAQAAESVAGSAQTSTERRSVGDIDEVVLTGGFDLRVQQGSTPAIELRGDAALLPLIDTVQDGQRLTIRWKRDSAVRARALPTITLTVVRLRKLAAAGSGNIHVDGLKTPSLDASISGAGDIHLGGLVSDTLAMRIAGSGDMTASGQATRLQVKIAGSGDVRASGLKADEVSVSIAGSGDAAVHADKSLEVRIAGSGDVAYSGNAAVSQSIVGSGSVRKR
ncbi:head GIN domain-containing protein [Ideonella sp. A 288]|uniref:head GIN domain-containing protein n=1 Tax=Ideonella sp. A 288 TaxID=1962181 RepID=UPI000B4B35D3|nr:head GIN domain-containing protein [Ideonella sp. A 288]